MQLENVANTDPNIQLRILSVYSDHISCGFFSSNMQVKNLQSLLTKNFAVYKQYNK